MDALHREDEIIGPSSRSVGLVFALVLALIGLAPFWGGRPVRLWALAAGSLFFVLALAAPWVLTPLNWLWTRLGLAMHRVMSPVIMAVLFYLAVTPFGLAMRMLRKGLGRRLRPDPAATTYWIDRAGQPPSRMDQQF